MKIICIENCIGAEAAGGESYVTVRSDSSILRNNDDFYLPHFSDRMLCGFGLCIRINRLVKSIEPRFAGRCYGSVGAGVAFTARDILERAFETGIPGDEAYCFDHSFAISPEFAGMADFGESAVLELHTGDELSRSIRLDNLRRTADEAVSRASQLLTLRTGDIVYAGTAADMPLRADDCIKVSIDGRTLLDFQII